MIDWYDLDLQIDKFNPFITKWEKQRIKKLLKQGVRKYGFMDGFTLLSGAIFRCMEVNGFVLKDGNLDLIKWIKCYKELYPNDKGK